MYLFDMIDLRSCAVAQGCGAGVGRFVAVNYRSVLELAIQACAVLGFPCCLCP